MSRHVELWDDLDVEVSSKLEKLPVVRHCVEASSRSGNSRTRSFAGYDAVDLGKIMASASANL